MKFGSLFAGVGGFDLGLEAAGWECGFQVEWDPHCQQVLAHHWPDVPRWGDVSTVNGADLPAVDVITFGSPCQDLSVAGKRAGLEGSRSGLFFEATRIIREMQHATGGTFPRYAIWENVVGALSSRGGDDFEAVLKEMANLGACHLEWSVLDAQFFGVPQRRRRVFVVAVYDSSIIERGGGQILAVGEGRTRNTTKGKSTRQTTSATVADSVGADSSDGVAAGYRMLAFGHYADDDQASAIKARDYKDATDLVVIDRAAFNQGVNAQYEPFIAETELAPSLVARGPHAVAHNAGGHDVVHETPPGAER
jgi:DNA (cytosine-5)-methyltransferase 1